MTATARGSSSSPALTKPMTITVAAELLWSTAVTASPVRTPSSGVAVSRASSRFMASLAARCKARLILSIP